MPFFRIAKQCCCGFPVTFPPGVPHRCPMVSMDGCDNTALLAQWRPFHLLLHSVPNRIPWLPFSQQKWYPFELRLKECPSALPVWIELIRLFLGSGQDHELHEAVGSGLSSLPFSFQMLPSRRTPSPFVPYPRPTSQPP